MRYLLTAAAKKRDLITAKKRIADSCRQFRGKLLNEIARRGSRFGFQVGGLVLLVGDVE